MSLIVPDRKNIINEIPLFYFKDFKIDIGETKKIDNLYDYSDTSNITLKQSVINSNEYKFKLFSMEIDNDLIDSDNCNTTPFITNYDLSVPNNKLNTLFSNEFKNIEFNELCNRNYTFNITTPAAAPAPGGVAPAAPVNTLSFAINNNYEDNLKDILKDIEDDYDIINFQNISPDNIKKLNDNLDGKDDNKFKLIHYNTKIKNKDVYFTTLYDKNKFDLLGYTLIKFNNEISGLLLILKMKKEFRILYNINSVSFINNKNYDYEHKINKFLNPDFVNTNNNININDILDDDSVKINPYELNNSLYKIFVLICCKILNKNNNIIDTNNKTDFRQHIKYPVYDKDRLTHRKINNLYNSIIFDDNLELTDNSVNNTYDFNDIFHNKYITIINNYGLKNFFDNVLSINISEYKIILDAFKYYGYSNCIGMGVEFNLGNDKYNFVRK
jgi:hypothetical protein